MTSNRLYSIRGSVVASQAHLKTTRACRHLLLALLWFSFISQPARCGRLQFDLNDPAPVDDDADNEAAAAAAAEDDATFNEIKAHQVKPRMQIRAQRQIQMQMLSSNVQVPQTNGSRESGTRHAYLAATPAEGKQQNWLERAHYWRSRASNAISFVESKLPNYFDFERFRQSFRRKYSPSEYFYRKAVFLSKCFQVMKARIAYRLGLAHHLEGVNKFSDRSAQEMRRMFMSGPPREFKPADQSISDYREQVKREFANREREADEQAQLVSKSSSGGRNNRYDGELEDEEREQLDKLARSFLQLANSSVDNEADQRPILNVDQAHRHLARIISLTEDETLKVAIREEVENGAIEGYSEASCAAPGECHSATTKASRALPWPGRQRSSPWPPGTELNRSGGDAQAALAQRPPLEQLDWSQHRCFHQVYDQGDKCGKCYVMASTTLAEFYKCSEQFNVIDQRKFSKDFVLDCGQKFSPSTIMGCMGGSILDTLTFIALSGAHNIRGWKERSQIELAKLKQNGSILSVLDSKCPLNKLETPMELWGDIKIEMNPKVIQVNEWMSALQDGPLVASVQMPPIGLDSYESGVHEGTGCQTSGLWHSMILVGYGQSQRGLAYWRFRNSWGPNWGDAGHFNLAMSVPSDCLAGGVRVYREPLERHSGNLPGVAN